MTNDYAYMINNDFGIYSLHCLHNLGIILYQ
jgi:hypothetical protein